MLCLHAYVNMNIYNIQKCGLNYRYKSDILILNEKWHQCEQSIVISEQIIIQQ